MAHGPNAGGDDEYIQQIYADAMSALNAWIRHHANRPGKREAMAHPNVDTSHILDALIELQLAVLGVEDYADDETFGWPSIKDAVARVRSTVAVTEHLTAAAHPTEQRRLNDLLDEISETYHLETGRPIVGPPSDQLMQSIKAAIWTFAPDTPMDRSEAEQSEPAVSDSQNALAQRFDFLCSESITRINEARPNDNDLGDITKIVDELIKTANALGFPSGSLELKSNAHELIGDDPPEKIVSLVMFHDPFGGWGKEKVLSARERVEGRTYRDITVKQNIARAREQAVKVLSRWRRYLKGIGLLDDAAIASTSTETVERFAWLLGATIRRLETKRDLLRAVKWDYSEGLNAVVVNQAAAAVSLGPIFEITQSRKGLIA